MKEDDSRRKAQDSDESAPGAQRREPVFSDFDEDDAFEESDRDTDFASAYEDEEPAEDDFEYDSDDEYDAVVEEEWQPVEPAHEWAGTAAAARASANPWDVPASADTDEVEAQPAKQRAMDEPGVDDYDDEDWEEEDYEPETREEFEAEDSHGWPIGLIIVAVVALVLLAAGGYGVIQQRAATQEEIRQLQAALATAASPAEVAAGREALQAMEQSNAQQLARIESLTLENRRLLDTVAGLEQQLETQQAAVAAREAAPKPAPKPKPAPPKPPAKPAPAASGDWFVNFSSYSQRSAADSWVRKLKPSDGKATVQAVNRDGKTLYRVRIVGLASRAEAEKVASQLQAAHGLPRLWVGTE